MLNPKIPAPLTDFEALREATTHNASVSLLVPKAENHFSPRAGRSKPFRMLRAEGNTHTEEAAAGSFLLALLICFLLIHTQAQQCAAGSGSKEHTPQESSECAEPRADIVSPALAGGRESTKGSFVYLSNLPSVSSSRTKYSSLCISGFLKG